MLNEIVLRVWQHVRYCWNEIIFIYYNNVKHTIHKVHRCNIILWIALNSVKWYHSEGNSPAALLTCYISQEHQLHPSNAIITNVSSLGYVIYSSTDIQFSRRINNMQKYTNYTCAMDFISFDSGEDCEHKNVGLSRYPAYVWCRMMLLNDTNWQNIQVTLLGYSVADDTPFRSCKHLKWTIICI